MVSRQNQKDVFCLKSRFSVHYGDTYLPRWMDLHNVLEVLGEIEFYLTVVILWSSRWTSFWDMIFANMGGLIGEIFTWGCRTGLIVDSRGTFKLTKGFKAAQKISKGRPSSQQLLVEAARCHLMFLLFSFLSLKRKMVNRCLCNLSVPEIIWK